MYAKCPMCQVIFITLYTLNIYIFILISQTYSGIFTHHIKPALSTVQVEELFGLLGYRVSLGASREEELRLGPSPALPDDLLRLACSFFTARCECKLLLSALEPLHLLTQGSSECELRIVQERRRGSSLQVALQSVQRSMGASSSSSSSHPSRELCSDSAEVDEDLYTGEGDGGGLGSPMALVMPLQARQPHRPLKQAHSSPALSTTGAATASSPSPTPTSPRCVSTLSYRLSSPSSPGGGSRLEPPRLVEEHTIQVTGSGPPGALCACAKYGSQCSYLCHQCNMFHCISCPVVNCCQECGHRVTFSSDALPPEPAASESKLVGTKDKRSSPPLSWREPPGFAERHSCLEARDEPHLTCHTCRRAHDYLCEEGQHCVQVSHQVEYQLEPSHSMPFHQCCTTAHSAPQFACLTCRVFHSASCPDGAACRLRHSVRELRGVCEFEECSLAPQILCRHCCAQFCRECWYKSPLTCLCGKPYDVCSPV